MKRTKGKIQLIVIYLFLIIFTLATLYPVMRVISISLRPGDRLLSTSLALIPEGATLDAYKKLFSDDRFLRWMLNSILVSTAVTLIGVILASMSGFIFSKYDFIGKKAGMTALLTTQMFPATMLLLPMYIMISKLGLINSFVGLIVIYSATALPFCIWQMKGYYDTIPNSLQEAAVEHELLPGVPSEGRERNLRRRRAAEGQQGLRRELGAGRQPARPSRGQNRDRPRRA